MPYYNTMYDIITRITLKRKTEEKTSFKETEVLYHNLKTESIEGLFKRGAAMVIITKI